MPDFASTDTSTIPFFDSNTYTVYQDGGVVKARNNKTGVITSDTTLDPLLTTLLASGDPSIEVQSGTYNLSGSFAGWTVPTAATIMFQQGTLIKVQPAYAGYVFNFGNDIHFTTIIGGQFDEQGTAAGDWTCIKFSPSAGNGAYFNSIKDVTAIHCRYTIHLLTATTSWINSNYFENVIGNNVEYLVFFEHTSTFTLGGSGSNANNFTNIVMQAQATGPQALGGIVNVNGDWNKFENCLVWDLQAANSGAASMTITSNARYTHIDGGILTNRNFTDSGIGTKIDEYFSSFQIGNTLKVKKIAEAGIDELMFDMSVTDSSGDGFTLQNYDATDGTFSPMFRSTQTSTGMTEWSPGMYFQSIIKAAVDLDAESAIIFGAKTSTNAALSKRCIFQINNLFTGIYKFYPNYADFTNKELRNTSGISQNPVYKRTGDYQPITPTSGTTAAVVGRLEGILGNHVPTGPGTNTNTWDTTEGLLVNLITTTTINQNAGLLSPTGAVAMFRRANAAKMVYRGKIDTVAAGVARLYFGVSSNATLNISDTIANGDSVVLVGFKAAETNYSIYHNDGTGVHSTTAITGPIAKNTSFHTISIEWTAAGNVVVTFDGVAQTISTDLPATTTNLFFHCLAQNATAAIRTHSIKGVWVESA